jgi:2'-5' RNA ligase
MMRLFIALPLEKVIEDHLARLITTLRQKGGQVRWVAPKNIHLTVRFLGDTEDDLVPELGRLIDETAAQFSPVHTQIDHMGAFPNLRRPNVIWVGLGDHIDVLAELANDIEAGVRQLGIKPDPKPFKAHLTLGRVKDSRNLGGLTNFIQDHQFAPVPLVLDRIVLFKSTLTPQGSIYDRLHERALGEERFLS